MPTINKRFLLKLLLVLFATVGVLFGVHAVQARRIPAALKLQSERAAEAGKLDLATHYLRQYLEFHPDDIEALEELAGLLTKRRPTPRGQSELLFLYDKILRIDPDRGAIRREALALSLVLGRYSDAVLHAERLLESSPTDAALWQQLGSAQSGLNELQAARKSYEAAVTHAPSEMIGYQRLAQLVWRNMNDAPGARDVLNRMVKALPQEPDAYMIRARFEVYTAEEPGVAIGRGGDLVRAREDLLRVLELDPEHAEASLLLSEVMQRNRNLPAAHALLRDAATLYPRDLKLIRALSWLELIRGNPAAAITVLEDGLKAVPDSFDLMVPLADLLMQQGDATRTADILRRLQDRRTPSTQLKYLNARVAMREQRWQDAIGMIESLRTEAINLPGLELQLNLLLASCFQKLGDQQNEETAYRRVVNADSKNVLAHVGLGNLYMNLGRFNEAAHELDLAVQSPYATGVVVAQWAKLKMVLLRGTTAPDEWRKLVQGIMALAVRFGRGSPEPAILLAETVVAQGRPLEAVRLLREEAVKRPGDARLWSALALMTAEASGTTAGLAVMDEAQAIAGDCAEVRLARATLYAREPGRLRPIDSLGEQIETWPESEQIRLLAGLVELYDQIDDQANVVRTLHRIVARQPASAALWLKLSQRATAGNPLTTEARSALVKIEGENGPSVVLWDAQRADPANAATQLARLTRTFSPSPTRADACLAMARCQSAMGDVQNATTLVERAFQLEPTSYDTAEAVLLHYVQRREMARVGQILTRLASDPRWTGEPFRRMMGHVLPRVPNAPELMNLCRPLVEQDPRGPAWLADCAVKFKYPEARALLDTATKSVRATSDDWLRKALFVAKEDPAAGPLVLAEAKAKLSPTAHFALVAVYADSAAGSTFVPEASTPAEKKLLAMARLALKLSQSRPAEGGKILESYLKEKNIPTADADWARRNLAMIYAVGGTQDDRLRATDLLKGVTTDDHASIEELRATVSAMTLLARYLEGPDRRAVLGKAIVALESIYKVSGAPTDLFMLSQMYREAGNRAETRRCLNKLLNGDPGKLKRDPSYAYYLTAALEELVEDKNFDAAASFAGKLMEFRANDFNSLAAVARFEAKAGRPERAMWVAEDYARLAESGAGDYLVRSAQVAALLDELSRLPNVRGTIPGRKITNAAVERFSALVPNRPEAIVGVAGALAADGRPTEAFERIERLDRHLTSRLRASAGLAIVRAGDVTEQQAGLVRKWIDTCLAEETDSIPLLLNKAEFLALLRDLPNATATFQQVLTKEPRNVVALNNLAWLHAADPKTAEKALDLVTRATRERGLTGDLLDTRARVRITLKQFKEAELDLAEAISHDPSPLRWFHVAVLRMSQTPASPVEAGKAFAEAKRRGLDKRMIHPADLPTYRVLETAGMNK